MGFLVVEQFLEVLFVEDELDVGLWVRQTLFLQRLPQLRRAAQKDPHFSSTGNKQVFSVIIYWLRT